MVRDVQLIGLRHDRQNQLHLDAAGCNLIPALDFKVGLSNCSWLHAKLLLSSTFADSLTTDLQLVKFMWVQRSKGDSCRKVGPVLSFVLNFCSKKKKKGKSEFDISHVITKCC